MLASIVGRLLLQVLTHPASRRGGRSQRFVSGRVYPRIIEPGGTPGLLKSGEIENSSDNYICDGRTRTERLDQDGQECGTAYHIGLDSCPLIRRTYRRYCELSIPLSPRRASCCLYRCSIVHVLTCRSSALDCCFVVRFGYCANRKACKLMITLDYDAITRMAMRRQSRLRKSSS